MWFIVAGVIVIWKYKRNVDDVETVLSAVCSILKYNLNFVCRKINVYYWFQTK